MKLEDSQYVKNLWKKWTEKKDEEAANELISHYMYLVQFHVDRIGSHIPDTYDKNELKSLGLLGLYDALKKFEPDRNLKFDTYATIRIRGSIMDGLRKEDWLPRTLREQSKKIDKVTQELEQRLMRSPDSADIAEALGKDREEIEQVVMSTMFANVLSIDASYHSNDTNDPSDLNLRLEDDNVITPDKHILQDEQKKELAEKIKQLNQNEQLVISLFYQEELTLTEIGHVLNLTTSRISQIHKRAIFKLRKILSKQQVLFE